MKILVMAGALRAGSYNKMLARAGAEALEALGVEVDLLDMREIPMPVYDGDLEDAEGLPEGAKAFQARIEAADGFMFASPEYNHSIPGAFKNALDWASRHDEAGFEGKVVGLMSASPGAFGGLRMLPHLRQVMMAFGCWVVPMQVTVMKAADAFDADGKLTSAFQLKQVAALAKAVVDETRRRLPAG
jgi:NAD(P)H-dependent FMN reductase